VSPGPLLSTPSISATVKTLENTEEESDETEPAGYGDIFKEYSDELYSPSTEKGTKNYM
jgi:hypothetical protein